MNVSQTKAWSMLTDAEKTSLNLSLINNKSTWEAGEIMGKAHYKYLEINQRATKFFKLFTEYFTAYNRLIPFKCGITPPFRKYVSSLIEDRAELKETLKKINHPDWVRPKTREREIVAGISCLKNSKFAEDQNLYHLLMDFDRWNNFRILPISIQEPSAFKRRNKHKLRKLVNLFTSLHPLAILKLKQLYALKKSGVSSNYLYLPLYTIHDPSITEIIKIPSDKNTVAKINNLILYTFKNLVDAERFMEIVIAYTNKDYKHCRDGQIFWPEFRVLTKNATNYDAIQNISPSRKYVLDNAGMDIDFQWFLAAKKKREDKSYETKISKIKQ